MGHQDLSCSRSSKGVLLIYSFRSQRQDGCLESKSLLLPGTRTNLLGNEIVLGLSENSSLSGYAALTDVTGCVISIGDPSSVPAGKYAKELLTNMGIMGHGRQAGAG